jgi:hypothetical protein
MAIDRALIFLGNGMPEIYGIEDPRNPVARMITRRELLSLFGSEVYAPMYPDELLWVVEVIGPVSTEGPPPHERGNDVPVRHVYRRPDQRLAQWRAGLRRP